MDHFFFLFIPNLTKMSSCEGAAIPGKGIIPEDKE